MLPRRFRLMIICLQIRLFYNKPVRNLRVWVSTLFQVLYILGKYYRKGWFRRTAQTQDVKKAEGSNRISNNIKRGCDRIVEVHSRWYRRQLYLLSIRKIKYFHERERLEAIKARSIYRNMN